MSPLDAVDEDARRNSTRDTDLDPEVDDIAGDVQGDDLGRTSGRRKDRLRVLDPERQQPSGFDDRRTLGHRGGRGFRAGDVDLAEHRTVSDRDVVGPPTAVRDRPRQGGAPE